MTMVAKFIKKIVVPLISDRSKKGQASDLKLLILHSEMRDYHQQILLAVCS